MARKTCTLEKWPELSETISNIHIESLFSNPERWLARQYGNTHLQSVAPELRTLEAFRVMDIAIARFYRGGGVDIESPVYEEDRFLHLVWGQSGGGAADEMDPANTLPPPPPPPPPPTREHMVLAHAAQLLTELTVLELPVAPAIVYVLDEWHAVWRSEVVSLVLWGSGLGPPVGIYFSAGDDYEPFQYSKQRLKKCFEAFQFAIQLKADAGG